MRAMRARLEGRDIAAKDPGCTFCPVSRPEEQTCV